MQQKFFEQDEIKYTTGLFCLSPNVVSVVSSEVLFSIDLRHQDWGTLRRIVEMVPVECEICEGPCAVEVNEIVA